MSDQGPLYCVGDEVEVLVHPEEYGQNNWLPATVSQVHSDTWHAMDLVRRGNRLEKLGAITMGFKGDSICVVGHNGLFANVRPAKPSWDCGQKSSRDFLDFSVSHHDPAEMKAMRSAVAWYVTFLERERDNRGGV